MAQHNEALAKLGRCERQLEELERRRRQLPGAIEAELSAGKKARDSIDEHRRAITEAERARRASESELREHEARRSKFQAQSAQVKTNEEYTALLAQIAGAGEQISRAEDAILEALEVGERLSGQTSAIEREQGAVERVHLSRAEELRAELADVEARIAQRDGERAALARELPEPLSRSYVLRRSSTGSGTTWIAGRSCGRCHRDIPYETLNRMRAGEGQLCGNCGRILTEDAPGTEESPPAS
jgi:predicted  nucleic acid-binding Zn-ribbon protein